MYQQFIILILSMLLTITGQTQGTDTQYALITHHDMVVTLNPDNHSIKGTDQITAKLPIGKNEIGFLLNKTINKVDVINSPGTKLFEKNISEFSKDYHESLEPGEIIYRYYIVKVNKPDSIIKFKLTYEGIIYDSLQTNEQEYSRGFSTTSGLIERRGIYLAGISGWIPTQKRGMFTFDLMTYLPKGWFSISQGKEIKRSLEEDHQINKWHCENPMEEVYLIAGKYIITEEDHHGINILTYTYQDEPELTQNYRQATKRYLDMYSQLIGPYPFKKFALVENFWQTGYGMPSFTLLGSEVIRLPFIIHTSYGHEILHNWWGNGVFVDWESGNWCEGLTNYLADHYYKKIAGEDANYRRTMLQSYLNYVQQERDFPLTEFKERHNPATQAVGYSKSAMVFHMLYKMLGEEKFLTAVKSFYKKNLFKTASWKDIETEFKTQSDNQDLSWFFDQWINRKGAPSIKIEDVQLSTQDSKYNVAIQLSQNTPNYRLLIPIRFFSEHDTTINVWMQQERQNYSFQLVTRPQKILVDPKFDVFRKLDQAEIPPALSQTLGALKALIILPGEASENIYQAYKNMAEGWHTSDDVIIKSDQEVQEQDFQDRAVWILGTMNNCLPKFHTLIPKEAVIDNNEWRINNQIFPAEGHSLIMTVRHPDQPELSWTLINVSNIDDLPSISRKIPHYGKYGYLIFKGAQNVLKGEWGIDNSPLIKEITLK